MNKIKQAIERKFPRYVIGPPETFTEILVHGDVVACVDDYAECEQIVKHHNELIDKLVEASELLAELSPQAVETTPKRWRQ